MADVVCFGPFELDTRTGDLRKKGKRLRLPPQPTRLLSLLVTRSGQLVTREEIRHHLWGGKTFVEYERSINACLAHLRSMLGDRAQAPRYIETCPGRGYRFIADVQRRRPFPQPTVAVLPFANLTGDPSLEHVADGLTDSLITELASISGLRVITRQSVLHLKGSSRTLREIAAELGADVLMEGSALCDGDRVCLNVQLVTASPPERHLWAKAYECPRNDMIAVHRQVATAVAESVDTALTPSEVQRFARPQRVNPAAHETYVKGCYYAADWSEESCNAALTLFDEAVSRDPAYAPAFAAKARILFNLAYWGYRPLEPTLTRAKEAAVAALALDEDLAAAHVAMGYVDWFRDWNLDALCREIDRALALSPSDPEAHILAALFTLTLQDDCDGAFADAEFALRLDPLSQSTHFLLAWCYLFGGDFSRALSEARKTLELFSDSLQAWYAVGLSHIALGQRQEAVVALEKAVSLSREAVALGYLGTAYALVGRCEDTRALLNELHALRAHRFVPLKPFIILHLALGEIEPALAAIEEAYNARDPIVFALGVTPPFAALRGHPRFEAVLERLPTHPRLSEELRRRRRSQRASGSRRIWQT